MDQTRQKRALCAIELKTLVEKVVSTDIANYYVIPMIIDIDKEATTLLKTHWLDLQDQKSMNIRAKANFDYLNSIGANVNFSDVLYKEDELGRTFFDTNKIDKFKYNTNTKYLVYANNLTLESLKTLDESYTSIDIEIAILVQCIEIIDNHINDIESFIKNRTNCIKHVSARNICKCTDCTE